MAAEVYHIGIEDNEFAGITGRIVEDGKTFYAAGYGDGTGNVTCVRVLKDVVEIFKADLTPKLSDTDQMPNIEEIEPLATLKPGEPHTEPLIGPRNNNRVVLHVRNIGDRALEAAPNYPYIGHAAQVSSN